MKGTVITRKGRQLIAKLAAQQKVLMFSRAAVGTGKIPEGMSPEDMLDLVRYRMDGAITSISSVENKATVVFQVSSIGILQEFAITEVGLYAEDPDEGEILYSYLDLSEDPQHIYAEGSAVSKFFETAMTVIVGAVENVTAYLDSNSLVTLEQFENNKIDMLVVGEAPKIEDRKKKTFYLIVTERQHLASGTDSIKVSPSMGLRMV